MNLAVTKKGDSKILFFIRDCVKVNNNYIGENMKLMDVKPELYDFFWTEDSVKIIDQNEQKFHPETTATLGSSSQYIDLGNKDISARIPALKQLAWISTKSYSDIEIYIDNNITDLESAKEFLKIL